MTDEEKQDYLLGQIMALGCAVRALLATHPEPEKAKARLIEELDATEGKNLPIPVQETFNKGLDKIRSYLL